MGTEIRKMLKRGLNISRSGADVERTFPFCVAFAFPY